MRLDCDNSRQPDGIIAFPLQQGKSLTLDSTCTDICSSAHYCFVSFPGIAAAADEDSKQMTYTTLASGQHYVPFSVHISGITAPLGYDSNLCIIDREDNSCATSLLFREFFSPLRVLTNSLSLDLARDANSHELVFKELPKAN